MAELCSLIEEGIRSSTEERSVAGHGPVVRPPVVPPQPLVVTRQRLAGALSSAAHASGPVYGKREPSIALACGALVSVLFRQLVTVGTIGDPMADGIAALSLDDRQAGLVYWIEALTRAAREELRAEVERQTGALARRWPVFEPSWLPRTDEAMQVVLSGGAVVLSARVDLVVGRPAEHEASIAMVELVSGARRQLHRADRHFAALVETLRHGAPPFVAATYYTSSGELDVEPIADELLVGAARHVVAGIDALVGPAAGTDRVPVRAPFSVSCPASRWDPADPCAGVTGEGGFPAEGGS